MDTSVKSKKLTDTDFKNNFNENSIIPWTEWKDTELNNEKWSIPQNGEDGLFLDTELTPMPLSLEPYEWIRPHFLKDLTEPLTVYTITKEYPDLIKRNKHLLHSEFIRWFISSLINLQYCGQNGLEVSGESNNFIWNGRKEKWQGWMHVYSNNKAGHGVSHRPIFNPNGKYIVRLYFLGCWRRIVVDDFIPVDKDGNPLLPTTGNGFELWPILLAKALLKIASLTWSHRREIVDFNPVSCFTGWICLSLNVVHLSPRDKWEFIVKYAEHFEWKQEGTNSENVTLVEEDEKKSRKKGKRNQRGVKGLQLPDKPRPITLFLDLEDMKEVTPETVPGLSPCWSHLVHVVQSRDLPLDPKDIKEPLPKWKEYRWINWAIDRGLLDPVEYFVPIRYLKIVSSLRECKEGVFLRKNLNSFINEFLEETTKNQEVISPEKKEKEETIDEISFWCDFNKMASYVNVVHLFYKPEYFGYTLRMSDSFLLDDQKNIILLPKKQKKDSRKGSRKSVPSDVVHDDSVEFMDTYAWPRTMKSSRNEPLYFFCDSVEEKFLLINFSTMEERLPLNIVSKGEEASDSVLIRSLSEDRSYLVVERHSWFFRPTESRALISISTSGTKSSVLELEPGRHLLRIYCRSESRCFISILSDTIFYVGDRLTIQPLMSTESARTDVLVKHISNSLAKAFFSFGSKDYSLNLKAFYHSYMPDLTNVSKKKDRATFKQIHDYFIEELFNSIKKIFPSEQLREILFSLKVFFLNPRIGLEHSKTPSILRVFQENGKSTSIENDSNESICEMIWINYDQAATIIQAFFKAVMVKQYKRRHNSNHKDHSKILTNLLMIVELFDHSKSESLASILLRNVIQRNKNFNEAYPCSKDFQYVLQIQECKGTLLNVKPDQWIPITRLIVNAQENETIFGTIQLFTNLTSYNLRLYNNETGREMWRVINNVAPSNYRHTTVGYTLFAYGYDNNQRSEDTEWILYFITMKGQPMFYQLADKEPISLNTKIPVLIIEETSNIYIPNSTNLISKWIVNIVRDSLLSFKLTTSFKLVQMKLRIIDQKDNVLLEIEGGFVLCVPVVYLKLEKENVNMENSRTTYYIEVFVLHDSWPLAETEWSLVLEAKTKNRNDLIRTKSSNIKIQKSDIIRTKRNSKQVVDQRLDSPFWKFQTVIDANSGVEIIQDRRREQEILSLKESWWKDDPERLQRGKELREAFLDTYSIRSISSMNLEEEISIEMNKRMGRRKIRESEIYKRLTLTESIVTKFLKYPRSRSFELPVLDLSKFQKIEEEMEISRIRSSSERKILTEQRYADVSDFFLTYDNFLQRLDDWSYEQLRKYKKLWNDLEENISQRKAQLEKVYETRQAYISSIKLLDTPKKVKKGEKRSART